MPGGIETASADFDGLLLSPSLTLGHSMITKAGTLTPSLRVRCAGMFLDGYSETGSSANLTIADRDIHVPDARAELAFGLTPYETDTGVLSSTIRVGLDGTLVGGDDVSATLLGQSLNFASADCDTLPGYAGFDASFAMGSNSNFTLSTEIGYDTSEALTGQVTAGLVWNF